MMFDKLPFFNGRHLNYSQFFFYLIFLLIFVVIVIFAIVDITLNVTLWYYRRANKKKVYKAQSSDSHPKSFNSSINKEVQDEYNGQEDARINNSKKEERKNRSTEIRNSNGELLKKEVELKARPHSSEVGKSRDQNYHDGNHSDENEPLNAVDSPSKYEGAEEINYNLQDPVKVRVLYYFIISLETIMLILLLFIWDVMNAFGIIFPGVLSLFAKSFIVMGVIPLAIMRFYFLFGAPRKYLNPNVSWKVKGPLLGVATLGIFAFNWGIMYFWRGICIANHNNDIAGMTFSNFGITTATTRGWYHNTCPDEDKPCFVYITYPEDAGSSIFINYHINLQACEDGE